MFANVLVFGIKCRNVFPIFSSLERGLANFFSDKRNIFSVGTGHLFPKNSPAYRARPPKSKEQCEIFSILLSSIEGILHRSIESALFEALSYETGKVHIRRKKDIIFSALFPVR